MWSYQLSSGMGIPASYDWFVLVKTLTSRFRIHTDKHLGVFQLTQFEPSMQNMPEPDKLRNIDCWYHYRSVFMKARRSVVCRNSRHRLAYLLL
ncbi:hypothetical protein SERLA73DRAFT_175056 [Serpula lacrymans var. lacrymans S7.3]|uniref:Uncharacterized protein n=1 Tax=Serpula lacrymans var. lacrymans (strain S7.3) TaxID=936435 RepID=F8PK95_SERL3|nr:hypothetical protein SERLA73DRAFT_175056 [Serpula lacrymans var. lacrymans S7.3]